LTSSLDRRSLFIGMKTDGTMRRMLRGLSGSNQRYVSEDDPSFLMLCRLGEDEYVGKRVDEPLTTDRVDDVRRNVLSILSRVCPDIRLPEHLEILAWSGDSPFSGSDPGLGNDEETAPADRHP